MDYRLLRDGDIDLEFDGELLVELSSHVDGMNRWTETRIYKTNSGQWVTEVVGKTTVIGEVDRRQVAVHRKAENVRLGLMRKVDGGERVLTHMGRRALFAAAQVDPDLVPGLTERI
jgi:hypothetical protein